MAKSEEARARGALGRCETMRDFQDVSDLIEERKHLVDLWDQLVNKLSSGPRVELQGVDRNSPGGNPWHVFLKVPRHVIDVMREECERRQAEITGILVNNYGIKDA